MSGQTGCGDSRSLRRRASPRSSRQPGRILCRFVDFDMPLPIHPALDLPVKEAVRGHQGSDSCPRVSIAGCNNDRLHAQVLTCLRTCRCKIDLPLYNLLVSLLITIERELSTGNVDANSNHCNHESHRDTRHRNHCRYRVPSIGRTWLSRQTAGLTGTSDITNALVGIAARL